MGWKRSARGAGFFVVLLIVELRGSVGLDVNFWKNTAGQTSWFASPIIYDLDGDGNNELIAAYYNVYVFDKDANLLDTFSPNPMSRVYAPHCIADLDNDGTVEIVIGNGYQVYALNWDGSSLSVKAGWPKNVLAPGQTSGVEVRGMSCADLSGDGTYQVIVSTTQTLDEVDGGSQVYVWDASGNSYEPAGATTTPSWPRYNYRTGTGNDRDRNGCGLNGYGSYGLNVAVGNVDDDPDLEIVVTYDNHEIEVFKKDGVAVDASDYFRSRSSQCLDERLTWGQFIRWYDADLEEAHYHDHTGPWPDINTQEWLQWTASPPGVADVDQDGKNEVFGIPNIELYVPYQTQAYGLAVFYGSQGNGSLGGTRFSGFETIPRGFKPIYVDGWYPPAGVPSVTAVDVTGDGKLELVFSGNDGHIYCANYQGELVWSYNFMHGRGEGFFPADGSLHPRPLYATEVTVADLDQDGKPELVFATYGAPDDLTAGFLVVLDRAGKSIADIPLPNPGLRNGNGNGAPTAPTIGDLNGDGQLEIIVQTFEHGMDIFTVPGSSPNCLLWPTARGSRLRMGSSPNVTCGTDDPLVYTPLPWPAMTSSGNFLLRSCTFLILFLAAV